MFYSLNCGKYILLKIDINIYIIFSGLLTDDVKFDLQNDLDPDLAKPFRKQVEWWLNKIY